MKTSMNSVGTVAGSVIVLQQSEAALKELLVVTF